MRCMIAISSIDDFFKKAIEMLKLKGACSEDFIVIKIKAEEEPSAVMTCSFKNVTLRTLLKNNRASKVMVAEKGKITFIVRDIMFDKSAYVSNDKNGIKFGEISDDLIKRRAAVSTSCLRIGSYAMEVFSVRDEDLKLPDRIEYDLTKHNASCAFPILYDPLNPKVNFKSFIEALRNFAKKDNGMYVYYGGAALTVKCSSLKYKSMPIFIEADFKIGNKTDYNVHPVTAEFFYLIDIILPKKTPVWMAWYQDVGWLINVKNYWLRIKEKER